MPMPCPRRVSMFPSSTIILILSSSFPRAIPGRILLLFTKSITTYSRAWRYPDCPFYGPCCSERASRRYPYPETSADAGPCIQHIANAKTVLWHGATARQTSHHLILEEASPTVPLQPRSKIQHCPKLARTCKRRARRKSTTNTRLNRGGKTTEREKQSQ
jgi:hypothetical protein